MELCWLTCACSALNGEELTRSGGVGLMGELLSRCVAGAKGTMPVLRLCLQQRHAVAWLMCMLCQHCPAQMGAMGQ